MAVHEGHSTWLTFPVLIKKKKRIFIPFQNDNEHRKFFSKQRCLKANVFTKVEQNFGKAKNKSTLHLFYILLGSRKNANGQCFVLLEIFFVFPRKSTFSIWPAA